jgi:hypothetical protein
MSGAQIIWRRMVKGKLMQREAVVAQCVSRHVPEGTEENLGQDSSCGDQSCVRNTKQECYPFDRGVWCMDLKLGL